MNQDRKHDIQVGIMVVASIVILVAGLMFFKRMSLDSNMTGYAVDFPAVEGLRKGDRVQVRGIRVGAVTEFEFLPGYVRVHMELEDWVELDTKAEVVLVMKGIVGEVLIEIEPAEGERAMPGHVFRGRNAASMLALGDKVNVALDQVSALGEEIRMFLAQMRGEGQIAGPLAATERTMLETEGMIAENRDALRAITGSLTHITAALEQAVGEGQLDTTLAVVHGAAENASLTMTELRATNESLGRILARLEAGEGTAGRLLTEDSLYVRADSTLMSMQRLIDQMRRNPKAMLNMSLF